MSNNLGGETDIKKRMREGKKKKQEEKKRILDEEKKKEQEEKKRILDEKMKRSEEKRKRNIDDKTKRIQEQRKRREELGKPEEKRKGQFRGNCNSSSSEERSWCLGGGSLLSNCRLEYALSSRKSEPSLTNEALSSRKSEPSVTNEAASKLPRYEMRKDNRGLCVIINNTYNSCENAEKIRHGSELDEKKLTGLFQDLSFIVKNERNLSADKMLKVAQRYGKQNHNNYDAFVFILMSHGGDDGIEGVDGVAISIETLMSEFKPTKCPSLQNKPKLFFIQSCRGDLSENSSQPTGTADAGGPWFSDSTLPNSLRPQEADFLLAFATPPGYKAYRNPQSGTLFIQTLVETIRELHHNHHLLDILTEVNRRVVEKGEHGGTIQVPAPTHTLRLQLYL